MKDIVNYFVKNKSYRVFMKIKDKYSLNMLLKYLYLYLREGGGGGARKFKRTEYFF